MLCEECPCEIHKVGDNGIVRVRPVGGEFKAVGGLRLLTVRVVRFLHGVPAGGVGIILRVRAVRYNENLHVFIKPAAGKERIPLIALDLIERLADGNAAALQFHVHERQTVD